VKILEYSNNSLHFFKNNIQCHAAKDRRYKIDRDIYRSLFFVAHRCTIERKLFIYASAISRNAPIKHICKNALTLEFVGLIPAHK